MKILKGVIIGATLGFAISFTTEFVFQITNASDETRNTVNKVTNTVASVAMLATLVI